MPVKQFWSHWDQILERCKWTSAEMCITVNLLVDIKYARKK